MTSTPIDNSISPDATRWQRIDAWCERVGDSFNPILVKETRQALKSRQFVTTFSILLFAALAWTVVGSLTLMPQIYTSPSAPRLLIGYYVVLAIPMLLVVPLAAYRSMEGEIDDGTLELLSITALSPWHIVLGKLASAMLQMVLYYVALFPCVAYAYTLRGVDLPTTLLLMSMLIVTAVMLTIIALFFAPLARTRTGRIVTLLAVLVTLLIAEWGIGILSVTMILYGNPLSGEWMMFLIIATGLISVTAGHLLLSATAAQLTPESENRSTRLRISLLVLTTVTIGLVAFGIQTLGRDAEDLLYWFAVALYVIWTIGGAMMAAESPVMTPRIRRELPSSFLSRMFLTWVTPGPVTGLIFSSICVTVLTGMVTAGILYVYSRPGAFRPNVSIPMNVHLAIAYAAYLIGFLVVVRMLVGLVRIKNHPRVEIGLAALVAVAVFTALIPYSIALHANDYRSFDYSGWQVTNWAWTFFLIQDGADMEVYVLSIASISIVLFFVAVLVSPKVVFPRRIATPKRVKAELEALQRS